MIKHKCEMLVTLAPWERISAAKNIQIVCSPAIVGLPRIYNRWRPKRTKKRKIEQHMLEVSCPVAG